MALMALKEDWRCVSTEPGAQSVTTDLMEMMLKSYATSSQKTMVIYKLKRGDVHNFLKLLFRVSSVEWLTIWTREW